MSTYTVNSTSELNAALKSASGGDTILMGSGTYDNVAINGISFATDVTITSKDPGNPAVITKLDVTGSQGITFTNLEMSTAGSTKVGGLFSVVDSNDITFHKVYVHGSLDGDVANDVDGFRFLNSKNVTVSESEFEQLRYALGHRDSDGLVVKGNYFHDIRVDAVRGSGSDDVLITKNYFTNFHRIEGDHSDAIQFWTGSTTESARNLTITDNIIDRGDGTAMQGVFLSDENGTLPFENVKISGNLLIGTNGNGIAVFGGGNVTVTNNTIVSAPDGTSWIRLSRIDGADVSGNYVGDDNSSKFLYKDVIGLSESGNVGGSSVTDGGTAMLESWLKLHGDLKLLFGEELGFGGGAAPPVTEVPGVGDGSSAVAPEGMIFHNSGESEVLVGGAGIDTISFAKASSGVWIDLSVETKQYMKGGGTTTVSGIENVEGSDWADKISGTDGNNVLKGGAGDDKLVGGVGADTLVGGSGADSFHIDALSHSTVALAGRDVFLDFSSVDGDRIILRDIDAIQSTPGNDAFKFVAKFTGVAGQLVSVYDTDHYVVMGDVTGDGIADFAVNVFSHTALTKADFFL